MSWWAAALAAAALALVATPLLRRVTGELGILRWGHVPAAALLGAAVGSHPATDAYPLVVFAAAGGLLVVADLVEHRLPDAVVLPAAGLVALGWVGVAGVTGEWGRLLTVGLAALAVFAGFLVLSLGPLGAGDVKLALLLGATLGWFGWPTVGVGVLAGVLLHGVVSAVVLLVTRDRAREVPMGPSLLLGAALALLPLL